MSHLRNKQSLSGVWTLKGFRKGNFPAIQIADATVPGNIELELEKHGLVPELFQGQNAKTLRPYEFYDFTYERDFEYTLQAENPVLHFEGIDCLADIVLNGVKLGECSNAFIPVEFPVAAVVKQGKNHLEVRLRSVVNAAKDFPLPIRAATPFTFNQEALFFRKPTHEFGWDISFRMMLGGIWKEVWLEDASHEAIQEIFLDTTSVAEDCANFQCYFKIATDAFEYCDKLVLELQGVCGDHRWVVTQPVWSYSMRFPVAIENPRLWNPRHYGQPNLYQVSAILKTPDGKILASKDFSLGVRTIQLVRKDLATPGDEPDFQFLVNGRPVRLWGTNHVLADVLHSRDCEQLRVIQENLLALDCNMVRCWGGGVYESEQFFDFCDANGILVWQDFMMACAIYPNDDEFVKKNEWEARCIVSSLRQHPSIALWCGDNECDLVAAWIGQGNISPETNEITRSLLPAICRDLDPRRPYMASSPCVSAGAFQLSRQNGKSRLEYLPETHLWYQLDHYTSPIYTEVNASFISEIGRMGCPGEETLRKMIPAENLWPVGNDDWLFHGSSPYLGDSDTFRERCLALTKGVETFLGRNADNLPDFILASQLYQAEGMKYLFEHFRRQKKCTGLLWWNLKDAAPLLSDAAVDYYGRRKLLWHYLANLQAGVCAMLKCDNNGLELQFCNDTADDFSGDWQIFDGESGNSLAKGTQTLKAAEQIILRPDCQVNTGLLLLQWQWGQRKYHNHLLLKKDSDGILAYCRKYLLPWYQPEK